MKNPGGTLAPTGGYVIGKRHYVDAAFKRLSAPGVEGGETHGLFETPCLFRSRACLFLSHTHLFVVCLFYVLLLHRRHLG